MPSNTRYQNLSAEHFIELDENKPTPAAAANIHQAILHLTKASPDGTTATKLAETLGITANTALKALRALQAEREVYSRQLGKLNVWYPNGQLIHPYLEFKQDLGGKPYRLSVQEGRNGPMVQVQERTFSLLDGERVEGAVFIDYSLLDDFIASLQELKRRFETVESHEVKK